MDLFTKNYTQIFTLKQLTPYMGLRKFVKR